MARFCSWGYRTVHRYSQWWRSNERYFTGSERLECTRLCLTPSDKYVIVSPVNSSIRLAALSAHSVLPFAGGNRASIHSDSVPHIWCDRLRDDWIRVDCRKVLLVPLLHVLHSPLLHILRDDGGGYHSQSQHRRHCFRFLLRNMEPFLWIHYSAAENPGVVEMVLLGVSRSLDLVWTSRLTVR
ncbi:hypothetical protein BHM03_00010840 [Ensete ventricosum]|nr:hypothetical protein BHM03_00010840 [Ensete ventricosum]